MNAATEGSCQATGATAMFGLQIDLVLLHNLGLLLGQPFKTVQQLTHYRQELGRQMAASLEPGATAHVS